jgi:hypothetical protein
MVAIHCCDGRKAHWQRRGHKNHRNTHLHHPPPNAAFQGSVLSCHEPTYTGRFVKSAAAVSLQSLPDSRKLVASCCLESSFRNVSCYRNVYEALNVLKRRRRASKDDACTGDRRILCNCKRVSVSKVVLYVCGWNERAMQHAIRGKSPSNMTCYADKITYQTVGSALSPESCGFDGAIRLRGC